MKNPGGIDESRCRPDAFGELFPSWLKLWQDPADNNRCEPCTGSPPRCLARDSLRSAHFACFEDFRVRYGLDGILGACRAGADCCHARRKSVNGCELGHCRGSTDSRHEYVVDVSPDRDGRLLYRPQGASEAADLAAIRGDRHRIGGCWTFELVFRFRHTDHELPRHFDLTIAIGERLQAHLHPLSDDRGESDAAECQRAVLRKLVE